MLRSCRNVATSLLSVASVLACSDGAATASPDVLGAGNTQELLLALNQLGIAGGSLQELPIGSAQIAGPDGVPMEVVALEFAQRVTLQSGEVLRASGISIIGVPRTGGQVALFDWLHAGILHTGSESSVMPGTLLSMGGTPATEFTVDAVQAFAGVRETATGEFRWSADGFFRFDGATFGSLRACDLSVPSGQDIVSCTMQTGLIIARMEFSLLLPGAGSQVVQEPVNLAIPAIRQVIAVQE